MINFPMCPLTLELGAAENGSGNLFGVLWLDLSKPKSIASEDISGRKMIITVVAELIR